MSLLDALFGIHQVQKADEDPITRKKLRFLGDSVSVADNPPNASCDVTISLFGGVGNDGEVPYANAGAVSWASGVKVAAAGLALLVASYIGVGSGTLAGTGQVRLPAGGAVVARNTSGDMPLIGASGSDVAVGDTDDTQDLLLQAATSINAVRGAYTVWQATSIEHRWRISTATALRITETTATTWGAAADGWYLAYDSVGAYAEWRVLPYMWLTQPSGQAYQVAYVSSAGNTLDYAANVKIDVSEGAIEFGASGVATSGHVRGAGTFSVVGYTASGNHPLLSLSSGEVALGDSNKTAGLKYRVATGSHQFYTAGSALTAQVGTSVQFFSPSDVTDYVTILTGATATTFARKTTSLTENTFLSAEAAAVTLGNSSPCATTTIWAGTTLYGMIGANAAWTATASSQTWKIGATVNMTLTSGHLSIGSGAASAGHVGLPTGGSLYCRNQANDADLRVFYKDSSDNVILGNTTSGVTALDAATQVLLRVGGTSWAAVNSGTSFFGHITQVGQVDLRASTSVRAQIGANDVWTATASEQSFSIGSNETFELTASTARVYRQSDLTAYWTLNVGSSTSCTLSFTNSGTTYNALYCSGTDLYVGQHTTHVETRLRASTTITAHLGSNAAWTANAGGHTWKVGSADAAQLAGGGWLVYYQSSSAIYLRSYVTSTYCLIHPVASGAANGYDLILQGGYCDYGYGAGDLILRAAQYDGDIIFQYDTVDVARWSESFESGAFRFYGDPGVTNYVQLRADATYGYVESNVILSLSSTAMYSAVSGTNEWVVNVGSSYAALRCKYDSAVMCGFFGTAPIAKPTVTGSRGGNAALASLCTALENLGLITDSTS